MPFPLIPLIGAGASILGNFINAGATNKANQQSEQFQLDMYNRQRADSLADWNMQNEYNSPSAQMQRLKTAGLNPNLVYGNGADATSSAMPRPSSPGSYSAKAPQYDFSGVGSSLLDAYDIRVKEAQTDNLKATNTAIVQDALLKAAQTSSTLATQDKTKVDTEQSRFNLSMAKSLQANTLEAAQVELSKKKADLSYTLDQNERAAASNAVSIQEGLERVLQIRSQTAQSDTMSRLIQQQIMNAKADGTLKQLDINLKEKGIQPHDPAWARVIAQLASGMTVQDVIRNMPTNEYNGTSGAGLWNIIKTGLFHK